MFSGCCSWHWMLSLPLSNKCLVIYKDWNALSWLPFWPYLLMLLMSHCRFLPRPLLQHTHTLRWFSGTNLHPSRPLQICNAVWFLSHKSFAVHFKSFLTVTVCTMPVPRSLSPIYRRLYVTEELLVFFWIFTKWNVTLCGELHYIERACAIRQKEHICLR